MDKVATFSDNFPDTPRIAVSFLGVADIKDNSSWPFLFCIRTKFSSLRKVKVVRGKEELIKQDPDGGGI